MAFPIDRQERIRTVRTTSFVLTIMLGFTGECAASGQASALVVARPDPYRNFVGSWSGTVPITAEKIPNTLKLVITEEQDRTAIRWDYVYGTKGEKGFTHDTEWMVLQPASAKLVAFRKHRSAVTYSTQGLAGFVRNGFGFFTADIVFGKNAEFDRVTIALEPNSLSYLWETSRDGKNYAPYLNFILKRDATSNQVKVIGNKE